MPKMTQQEVAKELLLQDEENSKNKMSASTKSELLNAGLGALGGAAGAALTAILSPKQQKYAQQKMSIPGGSVSALNHSATAMPGTTRPDLNVQNAGLALALLQKGGYK